jgi:glucose/arabinose dehydrogenase
MLLVMWTDLLALALLVLWLALIAWGMALLVQRRWVFGVVFVLEALAALAIGYVLATTPIGIGATLLRIPLSTAQWLALLALIVVATVVVGLGVARRRGAINLASPKRSALIATALLVPVLSAAGLYGIVFANTPERERERDPNKRTLVLPVGFTASVFAQGQMDNPTAIAFAPNGDLYIADISGALWVAKDADGDFVADSVTKFADGFNLLVGLLWVKDELFTSSSGKIEALRDTNGDGTADARRTVASGLPSLILAPHSNNALTLGPDGRIYFGVGTTTRGPETNPLGGSILSVSPDGGDVTVFARGFGNPFKLAFNSRGDMFAGDNSLAYGVGEPPPDKLNHVVQGGDYSASPPLAALPPSSVPTGIAIYTGTTYPQEYFDNAFLALWNKGEIVRAQLVPREDGNYDVGTSRFGEGFLYPIDIVVGPDGNLYVADFGTSVVYRITYGAQ